MNNADEYNISFDNADELITVLSEAFLKFILPQIVLKTALYIEKKYTLHREFNGKEYKTIDLPPRLIREHIEPNSNLLSNQDYKNEIHNFVDTIVKKMPNNNYCFLFDNLSTLLIQKSNLALYNLFFSSNAIAIYKAAHNKIKLGGKNYLDSIYHELFHMASTKYFKKIKKTFSGFFQMDKSNRSIGSGINEGYTENLTIRYFGDGNDSKSGYYKELAYARLIEQIVGQNNMERLYFKADLYGLIEEMTRYCDKESAINLIKNIDFIKKHHKILLSNEENDMVISKFRDVSIFLAKIFAYKLVIKQSEECKSIEELTNEIRTYVSSIPHKDIINLKEYKYIEYEELINIIRDILRQSKIEIPEIIIEEKSDTNEDNLKESNESSISR